MRNLFMPLLVIAIFSIFNNDESIKADTEVVTLSTEIPCDCL